MRDGRFRPAWVALGLLCACDGSGGTEGHQLPQSNPGSADVSAVRDPPDLPGSCPIALSELAAYQTVKIPLARDGQAIGARNADLIHNKAALVRAFFVPAQPAEPKSLRARLTVTAGGRTRTFDDTKSVVGPSTEGDLSSTFNFELGAEDVTQDSTISVAVLGYTGCRTEPSARLPSTGALPVGARRIGTLRIWIVPVRYDADGSGRMPDTSEAQIARYRDLLLALYPVSNVEITVRDVLPWDGDITPAGWTRLLDFLRAQRARSNIPPDTYYYGLVSPADTFRTYCRSSCIEGISYISANSSAALQVGVGVGFPGDEAAGTLAHELGHQHGRRHAPCAATEGLDPDYPYERGATGSWGFDARTSSLLDPGRVRDIMGYCRPNWISDYNYQALLERSAATNRIAFARGGSQVPQRWRVLIDDGHGHVTWGAPAGEDLGRADGTPVVGRVLGARGEIAADVELVRIDVADAEGATYLVPEPRAGWHSIALAGLPPLPFSSFEK